MEFLIIIALTLVNGIFSMSEAAVIATRRARLQQALEKGDTRAAATLALADNPNRFLSTVQIFITLIGVLGGAFGGATIAEQIADALRSTPLAPQADAIGFALIVIITSYLSLVLGELVPKRLALRSPENIAMLVSGPMAVLSKISAPLVNVLSVSTNAVLWLIGASRTEESPVTGDEITTMVEQGVEAGLFDKTAADMVEGVFRIGESRITAFMTPRLNVVYLDVQDTLEENRAKIAESPFSRYPVCDGGLDNVLGLVETKELTARMFGGGDFDLKSVMVEGIFVPERVGAARVMELFRVRSVHMAFLLDEYGGFLGIVTMQDMLEEIIGEAGDDDEPTPQDTTWTLEGLMAIDELKDLLELDEIKGEGDEFETLGGFVMAQIGHIPQIGDQFNWQAFTFTVLQMDGKRVGEVLITRRPDYQPEE